MKTFAVLAGITALATAASSSVAAVESTAVSAPAAFSTAAPESGDKKYDVASFSKYLEAQPGSDADFTVEEFIAWLEKLDSGSSTAEPAASASAPVVISAVPFSNSTTAAPFTLATTAPSTLATAVQPAPTNGTVSGSGEVEKYGQCGGINYTGSTACASGFTCKVQNPFYSQCVDSEDATQFTAAAVSVNIPTVAPSTLVTAVRPTSTASGSGEVEKYGQCGGINYTGSTACASGFTCKVQNPFYSQCVDPQDATAPYSNSTTPLNNSTATPINLFTAAPSLVV